MQNNIELSGRYFTWANSRGTSTLERIGISNFPIGFSVKSHTGVVKTFVPDHEVMEANEFFDGEASAYRSTDDTVSILIYVG